MKKSVLIILFGVASLYAQEGAASGQAASTKTTANTKTTAKTGTTAETKTTKTTNSVKSTQTTAPAPATAAIATSVPKDAEPLGQGRYRQVDAAGVAWVYQTTPFGITKTRESDLQTKVGQGSPFGPAMKTRERPSPQEVPPIHSVTAFPNGDEIRFEKESPFGKSTWTKKRTDELNDVEKSALANAEKTTAASGKN